MGEPLTPPYAYDEEVWIHYSPVVVLFASIGWHLGKLDTRFARASPTFQLHVPLHVVSFCGPFQDVLQWVKKGFHRSEVYASRVHF